MRILLIDPPYERLIGFKSEWFPLGLSYLAAYLMSHRQHEVSIYHAEHGFDTEYKSIVRYSKDFNKYKLAIESDQHPIWGEVRNQITSFKPDIVGVSVLTPKVPSAFKIANICKDMNPHIFVVFGGYHPTIKAEEMLLNKNVDFVVRGEGEETLSLLMENLKGLKMSYYDIEGLSFRDDGRIIHNRARKLIDNIDTLPLPARDKLFNFRTYTTTQLSMMMTSRGCPYDCGFCASSSMWQRRVRFRSIDNVLHEIKELKESYSVKNIAFMDDAFTLNTDRVKKFCLALLENHMDITWSCLTRVNMISDDVIALMKKAGCVKMDVGIESGNARILKLISKGITLGQVREAVDILRRNKMYWSGFFMFGFPTETQEEVFDTLNFLKELKPDWANMSIFTAYPGTALYNLALEKGVLKEPLDYTSYSHQNPYGRFTDQIPKEKFLPLANRVLAEVNRYNSSCKSLWRRASTRRYHKNPRLLFQDAKKVMTWLKK